MYLILLLVFVLFLILFPFLSINKEGLENKSCESDINTIVYKNSGTINHLQKIVDDLMKKVNQIMVSNNKQDSDIQILKEQENKNEKIIIEADSLAKDNKERLMELANQAKQQSAQTQAESDKIPSMK